MRKFRGRSSLAEASQGVGIHEDGIKEGVSRMKGYTVAKSSTEIGESSARWRSACGDLIRSGTKKQRRDDVLPFDTEFLTLKGEINGRECFFLAVAAGDHHQLTTETDMALPAVVRSVRKPKFHTRVKCADDLDRKCLFAVQNIKIGLVFMKSEEPKRICDENAPLVAADYAQKPPSFM